MADSNSNPFTNLLAPYMKTATPIREDEAYYAALGRFIVSHAGAENYIHQVARKLTRVNDTKARLLFGGMRIGEVVSKIKALMAVAKISPKIRADIEACLIQMDVLGKQRDKIAHRDTFYDAGTFTVSNILTSKSALEYERDFFTLADLLNLHADCLTIQVRFAYFLKPHRRKSTDKDLLRALYEPWLYKPPKPKTHKRPSRATLEIARLLNQPTSSQVK